MKLFLSMISLMISAVSAEEAPAFLKDAEIKVTLKDGSTSSFSANEWKVVPRTDKRKPKAIAKTENKNRVSVLGGFGATGSVSDRKLAATKTRINTNESAVGGLQYQRKLDDRFSIGVQGQSNKTISVMIGLDF